MPRSDARARARERLRTQKEKAVARARARASRDGDRQSERIEQRQTKSRRSLRERRQQMDQRVERLRNRPSLKERQEAKARRRKRRRQILLVVLALLLLLLLLRRCDVQRGAGPAGTPVAGQPTPVPTPALTARTKTQKRPGYSVAARPGPDWLDEFRLQVAARSPRLAACFNGSERSGAIRWTASIDAATGAVTGHEFEPLGTTAILSADQKRCATQALSQPNYRLTLRPHQPLPDRVSMVLEF